MQGTHTPTGEDPEREAIRQRLRAQLAGPAAPGAVLQDVTDAGFDAFVRAHRLALVDLWAPWCGPCHAIAPVVEALSKELAGRLAVGKLNADQNPATMQRFQVMGIPTLLLFKDGKLVERIVGALPKPHLQARIAPHLD